MNYFFSRKILGKKIKTMSLFSSFKLLWNNLKILFVLLISPFLYELVVYIDVSRKTVLIYSKMSTYFNTSYYTPKIKMVLIVSNHDLWKIIFSLKKDSFYRSKRLFIFIIQEKIIVKKLNDPYTCIVKQCLCHIVLCIIKIPLSI